jgi:hypothetical protein
MKVALFYLPDVKYGGWPTYTAHLYHGLKAGGFEPYLFRIGARTEKQTRDWGRGIRYQNLSLIDAVHYASEMRSIITATTQKFTHETDALVSVGATVIIHDPTELKGDIPAILRRAASVVTIRPINVVNLEKQGIQSSYIPHPYMRNPAAFSRRIKWAGAFSRIDWDKGTHFIVDANDKLPDDKKITIHGAVNRMYAHHKLPEHWENHYAGQFSADNLWGGAILASRYQWAVDMSTISGDGGGTQYTFLEAIDAGTALMLNEGWVTGRPDDELLGYASFTKPEDLAEAIKEAPTVYGDALLEKHDAATIAARTMEA